MKKLKIAISKEIPETIYLPQGSILVTNDHHCFTAIQTRDDGLNIMTFETDSLIDDADYNFEDYGTLYITDKELSIILEYVKANKKQFPQSTKLLK